MTFPAWHEEPVGKAHKRDSFDYGMLTTTPTCKGSRVRTSRNFWNLRKLNESRKHIVLGDSISVQLRAVLWEFPFVLFPFGFNIRK